MEKEVQIYVLNHFYKKWLADNQERILTEIKEKYITEKGEPILIDDEHIIEMLKSAKITNKL